MESPLRNTEEEQCVFVCVSVALFIQHQKRMSRIILSSVACVSLPYFSTLSHKRHDSQKKIIELEMCVVIRFKICSRNISRSKKN
jgi:hypothetical protein